MGQGLHTGQAVRMSLRPASAEFGIWFRRKDVHDRDNMIAARWDTVAGSDHCTKLANASGISVSTVEHILAAIVGCGIQNVLIELDGPEVPILDGSAAQFVRGILSKGVREQSTAVRVLELIDEVSVSNGTARASLSPAGTLEIRFEIDFEDAAIGRQDKTVVMSNGAFVRELCDSRTFCSQEDAQAMQARGLAQGGSLTNAVVVEGDQILSPGGLRHADEAVRHKMLDALGDLALAGAPILARYQANRGGHALTHALLRALFARPEAFRMRSLDAHQAAHLPGVGLTREDLPKAM